MPTALVLNGNLKSALAVVRSLGMAGISVVCGDERGTGMACHSKYVAERFVYPSPATDQRGFMNAVLAEAKKCPEPPVLYAFSDATYLTLYQFKDELEGVALLSFSPMTSMEIAFDKAATYSEASVHGIPAIKTFLPERTDEIQRIVSSLEYPAVVKTRHSITWVTGSGVSGTANFVHSKEELIAKFASLQKDTGEAPIVQPFVKGEEYGVALLVKEGKVYADAVHHRLRSLSPTGGASVLKESIDDTELADTLRTYAYSLVEMLSWTGPMMVEFKVDGDTFEPKLMELNGRWVGSLPLTVAAGADFPLLYFKQLSESLLPDSIVRAQGDVTTRHFLGDVRHLLRTLFSRDCMRPFLYPTRKKALKDFFKLPSGTKSDVWSFRDPKPALVEYVDVIKNLRVGK